MKILKESNILMAGPLPPPLTGQSFSFIETISVIDCKRKYVVNQNFEGNKTYIKWIKTLCLFPRYFFFFIFKKIDIVYFTGTRSNQGSIKDVVLIFLALLFNKKTVNHIHGANFKGFISKLPRSYRKVVLFAYGRINCSIVLLDEMKETMKPFLVNHQLKAVPNFYDPLLDQFYTRGENNDNIEICFFSNLMYSKGIFDLIEAFKVLNVRYDNIKLKIAGSFMSDDYMSANQVAEKLKYERDMNNNIVYTGPITGKAKSAFLESSHIFVLPTFYIEEAFPISILEAMRCGCVLICSDHNYIKYFVSGQNGSLVKVRDIKALSDAIQHYVDNPALMTKISTYNMEFAKNNFSKHSYGKQMNAILQEVLTS